MQRVMLRRGGFALGLNMMVVGRRGKGVERFELKFQFSRFDCWLEKWGFLRSESVGWGSLK